MRRAKRGIHAIEVVGHRAQESAPFALGPPPEGTVVAT
jgi:hypothetical protein